MPKAVPYLIQWLGAVIVHNGEIIGEGYHHKAGEPHAEVMAIKSVKDSSLLASSTLYCSLEPAPIMEKRRLVAF
jgi:pyrimidine deaminase RibD-like protein